MTERHRLYLTAPGFEDTDLVDGFLAGCRLEALAEDWSPGNPEPITTTVRGWMRDGAMVSEDGFDLRTIAWRQKVSGPDSATVAQGEAALAVRLRTKGAALTWVTPDGTSSTVWDIAYGGVPAVAWDDLDEMQQQVVLDLSALALPFGRSLEPITVTTSTAGTPAGATITDCTATTGWASLEGTPSVDGGTAVKVQNNTADALSLIYGAFGIAAPAGRLLVVEWAVTGATVIGAPGAWVGYPTGYQNLVPVSHEAIDATWYRSTYMVPPPGGISINRGVPSWFWFFAPGPMSGGTRHFRIRDVSYTATLLHPRSRSVALSVAGSARASGTLTIEGTAGLGTTLLGASTQTAPVLRLSAYRAGGGTVTADSTCVSGGYSAVSSYPLYKPPAALVPPGLYAVMARLKHATAGTYSITVDDGISAHDIVTTVTLAAGAWTMLTLGTVALPRRTFADPATGQVWVSLDGAASLQVDEVWLVHVDAALLHVEAGSATKVSILPPSPSLPTGAVYADGLSVAPTSGSPAAFSLEPGEQVLSVVTAGNDDPELTLDYTPTWIGHAGS